MKPPATKPYGRRDTILPLELIDDSNVQGEDESGIMMKGWEVESVSTYYVRYLAESFLIICV